jgi:hypothetical protein
MIYGYGDQGDSFPFDKDTPAYRTVTDKNKLPEYVVRSRNPGVVLIRCGLVQCG